MLAFDRILRIWVAIACLGVTACGDDDASDSSTLVVRFEPEADDFYRMPWPSDARLTDQGTPDLSDFPSRRGFLDTTLTEIERTVRGFATMPVVYLALSQPVSDDTLPQGLDALSEQSPIQLIDLSEEGCGTRFPLELEYRADGDGLRADGVLQIANAVGTVLSPGRPHGLIVLRSFGAQDERSTSRPDAFDRALADTAGSDPLSRSLSPLRRCLPGAGVALDDVAVATVFTPQDPVAELHALHELVTDPARVETRPVRQWRASDGWSRRRLELVTHVGVVDMPVFQEGETPYVTEGGALVFDADGAPVIQRWEEVPIAVSQQTFGTPLPGPRPVLVLMDGTGWTPWSHLRDNWIDELLAEGWVVMSFMPQFHGGRAGFDGDTRISTFNLPNPPAIRTNFMQEAAEISYFVRLAREQIPGLAGLPELDTANLVYGGHSQGALCGALVAAVEDQFRAYHFSGLSSFLTLTIIHRKDFIDFEGVVTALYNFTGTLDRFHPLLQLLQMGAEVVDPHNYVRLWHGWEGNPGGNHVFVTNGFEDQTTTPRGMEHMTMAADMQPIETPGWEIDPVGVWDGTPVTMPVQGNATSVSGDPLTIATYLDGEQAHGTVYRVPFARQLSASFFRTARTGVPLLASTDEFQCGDAADGDMDGMVDCADPDCAMRPPCVEGPCDNDEDEDGNGMVDCADPVCAADAACVETECGDGMDEDGDGATDCADSDCAGRAPCAEENCGNRRDDDGDGASDCDDSDCTDDDACHERRCTDERDDDRDGLTDCEDPECATTDACPEPACDDGTDEDMDGLIDCADPGCGSAMMCEQPTESDCSDGLDDDGDGVADCGDADCALESMCAAGTCADGDLGSQVGVGLWSGMLDGRTNDYPPGDCIGLGHGDETPDVAFLWTAPAAGEYVVSTWGSEIDTILSVLAPDCDPLMELACNDDDQGGLASSVATVTLADAEQVVIVVGAYDDADPEDIEGTVVLHVYPRPPAPP